MRLYRIPFDPVACEEAAHKLFAMDAPHFLLGSKDDPRVKSAKKENTKHAA
jgi:hypothetical protein